MIPQNTEVLFNPIQMGFFGAAHEWMGVQKGP